MKNVKWSLVLLACVESLIFLFFLLFVSGLPGVFDPESLIIGKGPSDASQIFACRSYNWRGGGVDSFCDLPTYIGHTMAVMRLSMALYFLVIVDSFWLPWSGFVTPLQRMWIIFFPWVILIFFYSVSFIVKRWLENKIGSPPSRG